jgi:hypothetical protein
MSLGQRVASLKPRLILHAGTHKTGTSTIQRALAENRLALSQQGIRYPDCRPWFKGGSELAHHRFAHAFARMDGSAIAAAREFVDDLRCQAAPLTILSAEAIYGHLIEPMPGGEAWAGEAYWQRRYDYLRAVAGALDGFDTEVLLFLRRPDSFAESLYRENVTTVSTTKSFAEWRQSKAALFDYTAQVDAFMRAFNRVEVLGYETSSAAGLLNVFFSHVGASAPTTQTWERRSADARVVLWFLIAGKGNSRDRLAFAGSPEAAELFDDYGKPSLWSSTSERHQFFLSFAGKYGSEYFDGQAYDMTQAFLSADDAERIDVAWAQWARRNATNARKV